jgi:hypothetical protein
MERPEPLRPRIFLRKVGGVGHGDRHVGTAEPGSRAPDQQQPECRLKCYIEQPKAAPASENSNTGGRPNRSCSTPTTGECTNCIAE